MLGAGMFLFCLLGMVFYMNHMVVNQMERSKQGLGTLSAFGLSIKALSGIYRTIVVTYIFIAFVAAFIVVFCIKLLISFWDFDHLLYVFHTAICLFFVMISLHFIAMKYLRRTPGDLIFNR
jgi:hypothetical protein